MGHVFVLTRDVAHKSSESLTHDNQFMIIIIIPVMFHWPGTFTDEWDDVDEAHAATVHLSGYLFLARHIRWCTNSKKCPPQLEKSRDGDLRPSYKSTYFVRQRSLNQFDFDTSSTGDITQRFSSCQVVVKVQHLGLGNGNLHQRKVTLNYHYFTVTQITGGAISL